MDRMEDGSAGVRELGAGSCRLFSEDTEAVASCLKANEDLYALRFLLVELRLPYRCRNTKMTPGSAAMDKQPSKSFAAAK